MILKSATGENARSNYVQWQKTQKHLYELALLMEAKQIEAKIDAGEMGTISHDELKRLLLEKRRE